jgi:hypothetical protein
MYTFNLRRPPMVSTVKVAGVTAIAVLLGLSLSMPTMAVVNPSPSDEIKTEQNADRKGSLPGLVKKDEESLRGIFTIRGEVLRVDRENYLVKRTDGKQVNLHIDETTQMTGNVGQGELIEAKVNEDHHALSIRPTRGH